MKLHSAAALILLLLACNKPSGLKLTVKAPEIANGIVIIKQNGQEVINEPFKNGQLNLAPQLQSPGYYTLTLFNTDKAIKNNMSYDIYLDNSEYNIEVNTANPDTYPKIETASATQRELSEYYAGEYKATSRIVEQIDSAKRRLATNEVSRLSKSERNKLYESARALQKKQRELQLDVLKQYVDKHPKTAIGAHIMANQYFVEDPAAYYAIFQKLSDSIKNSDDGLNISNKLMPLVNMIAGAEAPQITGNTPDGKPFNKKQVGNKVILVEFWEPDNDMSQLTHERIVPGIILTPADRKYFSVVSVSVGDDAAAWKKAIKGNHVAWVQVSDNKGDASPNVSSWGIKKLPAFFLLDKNWKILKPNIAFEEVDTEVHEYLKTH
ncbi:hypothetical protein DYU05_19155 [Mucilaginibacter terrenus]|uniref:Uncharacterized protein n=1 Tax=Mucilaginibacter terrenus TaxID=2482727 RepID=A0A3E2NKC1_9SPHI|nr:thioredoxin-like domain-containing protein [Mucilaginibacter terrenus]RFZ81401.1 hypothetical protein DYU05_19155 [Mucilaginibacter terrenus]